MASPATRTRRLEKLATNCEIGETRIRLFPAVRYFFKKPVGGIAGDQGKNFYFNGIGNVIASPHLFGSEFAAFDHDVRPHLIDHAANLYVVKNNYLIHHIERFYNGFAIGFAVHWVPSTFELARSAVGVDA